DQKAFEKIGSYIAEAGPGARVVAGGKTRGEAGYFIEPTLIEADDPGHRLLKEEIFGPVVTVHVYDDARWHATLRVVDPTSPAPRLPLPVHVRGVGGAQRPPSAWPEAGRAVIDRRTAASGARSSKRTSRPSATTPSRRQSSSRSTLIGASPIFP